jgi:hypothetical protein
MSGHLRFCFAIFVLFASLSMSPASANPFSDLFSVAPQTEAAPAPAEGECLPRPGKSTAAGQHWVYRLDSHRKCWFLATEGIATAKKRVDHQTAKNRDALPTEATTAWRKWEAVVDARAELLRPAAAEAIQPAPPASKPKVVDTASVPTGVAALVPPAVAANRAIDQLTPDHHAPRQVDVETLLAAAPAVSDAAAPLRASGPPVAFPLDGAGDEARGWKLNWLGVLLMVLGLVFVLSSSRVLRSAALLRGRSSLRFAKGS